MTTLHSIEWKTDMKMWRTPDAHCGRGASSKERMEMKLEKGMPISLNDQVAHPNLMWPTPNTRLGNGENEKVQSRGQTSDSSSTRGREQMWPTPRASKAMSGGREQHQGERSGQGEVGGASGSNVANTDTERLQGGRTV